MVTSVFTTFCVFLQIIRYTSTELVILPKEDNRGERAPPGSPWPYPRIWTRMTEQFSLSPEHFEFKSDTKCDIIEEALLRYRGLIFIDSKASISPIHKELETLRIDIKHKDCGKPKFQDNESYNLIIPDKGSSATLHAKTVWGALRGLETFSQLVYIDDNTNYYLINATKIEDWPRFPYRGIMLDTARHFVPMATLFRVIDTMAWNKFNVFHWHIVDDQSWPLESKIYPNLTKMGAFSEKMVYKQEDVRHLIKYARLRGIRVIPEIDSPGHTAVMGKGIPSLLTTCYDGDTPAQAVHGRHNEYENLNPTRNETFEIMKKIFSEVKSVFSDEYIHLGMDEAYYGCWESSPEIKNFMKQRGFYSMNQVEKYYIERTLQNVKNIGYKYIIWQDPIDNNVQVPKDAIVQIWKADGWQDKAKALIVKQHNLIISACWYLNKISYGEDWQKYYQCDPVSEVQGDPADKKYIIGGEACLWGEYVDQTNLLSRLWPRACAVAERLWSSSSDTQNIDAARFRLDRQRCRMLRRGVQSQPIYPGYCGDWEVDLDVQVRHSSASQNIIANYYNRLFVFIIIFIYLFPH